MDNEALVEQKKLELELSILYPKKELLVGYALLFVAGFFGAHRFYLGRIGTAMTQVILLISSIFLFGIPAIFLSLWLLLDIYFVFAITDEINNKAEFDRLEYMKSNSNTDKLAESEVSQ